MLTIENNTLVQGVDQVKMALPCKGEYVGVVRLTISAIANRMGFNVEEIEDIKVAVSEGCTNAIKHSQDEIFDLDIRVYNNKLEIIIKDSGKGFEVEKIPQPDLENPKENGLGLFIIKTLMDEVSLDSKVGEGSQLTMVKFLGDGK